MCKQNNVEALHIISVRYTWDHSPRDIGLHVITIAPLSSHNSILFVTIFYDMCICSLILHAWHWEIIPCCDECYVLSHLEG